MFNKAGSLGVPLDEKAYMNLIGYYGKAGNGPFYITDEILIILDAILRLKISFYLFSRA